MLHFDAAGAPRLGGITVLTIALGSAAVLLQVAVVAAALRGAGGERVLRFALAVFALQQASNAVQLGAVFNQGRFLAAAAGS